MRVVDGRCVQHRVRWSLHGGVPVRKYSVRRRVVMREEATLENGMVSFKNNNVDRYARARFRGFAAAFNGACRSVHAIA